MDIQWTYLLVNFGAIILPLIFTFHPLLRFDKNWSAFFPACFLVAIGFIVWDVWFTDMGIWGFNPDYLSGIYLINLPIEEWLFFFCIPYACVFSYHTLKVLIRKEILKKTTPILTLFMAISLIILGLLNLERWYTSVTFLLTGSFLLFHHFKLKKEYLGMFYLSFVAILPFFFLTNGILTGSWTAAPIVWYNDMENLSFRLGTIPVEDTFYGLLLLLLNVTLYEFFLEKNSTTPLEMKN